MSTRGHEVVKETANYICTQTENSLGGFTYHLWVYESYTGSGQPFNNVLNKHRALRWLANLQEAYDTPGTEVIGKPEALVRREHQRAIQRGERGNPV